MAKINVAQTVIGGEGNGAGGAAYANSMLTIMGMKAAKDLNLDMKVK